MLTILYGIIAVAAVIGFAEVIGWIQQKIIYGRRKFDTVSVVPFRGHVENAELIVRDAMSSLRWNNRRSPSSLIIIDAGMDAETRCICDILSEDLDGVAVCTQQEAGGVLAEKLHFPGK